MFGKQNQVHMKKLAFILVHEYDTTRLECIIEIIVCFYPVDMTKEDPER